MLGQVERFSRLFHHHLVESTARSIGVLVTQTFEIFDEVFNHFLLSPIGCFLSVIPNDVPSGVESRDVESRRRLLHEQGDNGLTGDIKHVCPGLYDSLVRSPQIVISLL